MTASEFRERLVALLHAQPFVPFEVELLSGERFIIDRRDAVSWGGSAAGFIAADGEIHLFDDTRTLRFNTLASTAST